MSSRIREWAQSPVVRMAAYFAVTAAILLILTWMFPWLRQLILPGAQGPLPSMGEAIPSTPLPGTYGQQVTQTAFLAVLTLLGALMFTAPMVWVYTVMLRQDGYDRSFVHMLVMLPVVVAGVVQIVRGDLALAFALAGIMAGVRFRTTVDDLQDAVFAFAGIGVGLATGSGSFALAGAISTVVCILFYVIWRFDIGTGESGFEALLSAPSLAEALVPGEATKAIALGDKTVVKPVLAEDLKSLTAHTEKLADYVRADSLRQTRKYRELLLVYTESPDEARARVEEVLKDHANRWVEVDRIHVGGDRALDVIEYLIRLKKSVQIGRMAEDLRSKNGNPILAVQIKPISGLRRQLDEG